MNENYLYFSISGEYAGKQISPDNSNLQMLTDLADSMNRFIKGKTKSSTNDITVSIKHGSFALLAQGGESLMPAISDYRIVLESGKLDGIDPVRAGVLKDLQSKAKKFTNRKFIISDNIHNNFDGNSIILSYDSDYKAEKESVWAESDVYEYGTIVDIGGKTKTNVHLVLEDGRTIVLDANTNQIANDRKNRLYRKQLVKIKVEQNLESGETRNEHLEEFLEYDPKFDEEEYKKVSLLVKRSWADVPDINAWVENMRGNYAQTI